MARSVAVMNPRAQSVSVTTLDLILNYTFNLPRLRRPKYLALPKMVVRMLR